MGDLSLNQTSFDTTQLQQKVSGDNSTNDTQSINSCFNPPTKPGESKVNKSTTQTTVGTQSSAAPQKSQEPAFKTNIEAFGKVNVKDGQTPQKIVNGIKIFATGSEEKIQVLNSGNKTKIVLGTNGQTIEIPAGQLQNNATIAYNGKTLAVKGLNGATITGLKDNEAKKEYVNNQMIAKDCKNCTFDMNDKANGWSESRDDLVLDNCKTSKVTTGQNNTIVGINGTNAEVSYASTVGKNAEKEPLKDWINKMPTNIAYDDSSALKMGDRGTINREQNHHVVYDAVKKAGATAEDNSYKLKDGTSVSASDYLLNVINEDAKDSNNASKSMFNDELSGKMSKLPTKDLIKQVEQIQNNYKKPTTE